VIDPSQFERSNVADTCSVWNVLTSRVLHEAAKSARVELCMTEFVRYECLHKPGQDRPERHVLQARLRREMKSGAITAYSLEVEDLQEIAILENRRRLSKGELSSIVLAKKTRQAFMTDDRKAANLASAVLSREKIQSTPHLFAWLFFTGLLLDCDKGLIVSQFAELKRNLEPHFENAYMEAMRCKLMACAPPRANDAEPSDGDSRRALGDR
jgi:hypothetical protein